MTPTPGKDFIVHCTDSTHEGSAEFDAPAADLTGISRDGRKVVYIALCPQGHQIELDPDYVTVDPEVRAATKALADLIASGRVVC